MIDKELLDFARINLENRVVALDNALLGDVIRRNVSFQKITAGLKLEDIRDWIRPFLGQDAGYPAIYRLSVNDQDGATKLRQAFEQFERPARLTLTRNNNVEDSRTVYVGSSKNVVSRLHQHLHTCACGTYALKLNLWCPDADNIIKIEVIPVRGAANAQLIQDLEDALWAKSHPMFGKFGAK